MSTIYYIFLSYLFDIIYNKLYIIKMKNDFDQLEKLLNLLSFKLDHKDYVAAFNLIYDLKPGDLTKDEVIDIFKKVAHIEYEFGNYKTFEIIKGGKNKK